MTKIVALISGGKDSFYTIHELLKDKDNQIVGLLHIKPKRENVLDSYMFQTVGTEIITAYGECMNLPIFIYESNMNSINIELKYTETINDEVEDLFFAISDLKDKIEFNAICSGAILSTYQKLRVENVCKRLSLQSLTPLWGRNQKELLNEISKNINAVVIKTATPVLNKYHVGMNIQDIKKLNISDKYFNWCGEGGEYETLTTDTPFFKKRIHLKEVKIEIHPEEENKESTVFYLKILDYALLHK